MPARPAAGLVLLALLAAPACRDFGGLKLPGEASRPVVESATPPLFFAGEQVKVSGRLLDAGAGETPQVWLGNVEAVVLGLADGADGLQVATVEAPGGIAVGEDLLVRVRTSGGEASKQTTVRYLGPGHLADRVDARASMVGIQPFGLAVSDTAMMVIDLWRNLVSVYDTIWYAREQIITLRVPTPGSDPLASEYSRPLVDDVALVTDSNRGLLTYWLEPASGDGPGIAGLVAFARCGDDLLWIPTRHFQLPAGDGRLPRVLYGEAARTFYVVRAGGRGGLLTLPASELPAKCKPGTTAVDQVLSLAPQPDAAWQVADLPEPLAEDDLSSDPGMSLSVDGTRLAVARQLADQTRVDVYDVSASPPAPARAPLEIPGDEAWVGDVVLYGPENRLAVLDTYWSVILREESPGVWMDSGIQTAYWVTGMHRGGGDSEVLVSTGNALLVVDLEQGRSTGSIPMPGYAMRALALPGLDPLMVATVSAEDEVNGQLLTFNRDARVATASWGLEYPVRQAAYSSDLDLIAARTRSDVGAPFLASPGSRFAWVTLDQKLDHASIDAVAADRDLLAFAGTRRSGVQLQNYVKIFKLSAAATDVEDLPGTTVSVEKRPVYLSPSSGRYVGMAPYGAGVVALKRDGFERVGTPECDRRGDAEFLLPGSCARALPAGWEVKSLPAIFAVAQGADEALLPQAVVEGEATRVVARLPLTSAGEPRGMSVLGAWVDSMVAASRDAKLVAVAAWPTCPEDEDCPATAFYALEGATTTGLQKVPWFQNQTSAVAVSPDGTTVYLAKRDGRVYAVRPGLDGVDYYEDVRMLVTIDGGWLTSLTAPSDGGSLAGTTDWPGSQLVLLQ